MKKKKKSSEYKGVTQTKATVPPAALTHGDGVCVAFVVDAEPP